MERLKIQHRAFLLFMIVLAAFFVWKIWNIHPLYASSAVRGGVRSALIHVTNREGWLLSDILVQEVSGSGARLLYQQHHRGKDSETCFILALKDSSLHPCAEKQN